MKKNTLTLILLMLTTTFAFANTSVFKETVQNVSIDNALKMEDNTYVSIHF